MQYALVGEQTSLVNDVDFFEMSLILNDLGHHCIMQVFVSLLQLYLI